MIINPNLPRILWNIPFFPQKVPAFSTTFLQTLLIFFQNFPVSSIRLLATCYQLCRYITRMVDIDEITKAFIKAMGSAGADWAADEAAGTEEVSKLLKTEGYRVS